MTTRPWIPWTADDDKALAALVESHSELRPGVAWPRIGQALGRTWQAARRRWADRSGRRSCDAQGAPRLCFMVRCNGQTYCKWCRKEAKS